MPEADQDRDLVECGKCGRFFWGIVKVDYSTMIGQTIACPYCGQEMFKRLRKLLGIERDDST